VSSHPRVLVYVAGPFSPTPSQREQNALSGVGPRHAVEQNIAHAGDLAIEVAKLGALPVCPHLNTSLPEFEDVQPYDFWIAGTDEMLLRCDVAVFTENYTESSGARGEMRTCIERNIPHFEALVDLAAFLAEPDVETFLQTLRLARVLEWGLDRVSTIPAPALPESDSAVTLPSIRSAEACADVDVDGHFGEIDTSDFDNFVPRSGALKL
jgi:hypothetical protein